jgi:hypothetical protein
MLYIANLPRPNNNDHGACKEQRRGHVKVNNDQYKTQNDGACEGCEHVGPDLSQLTRILKDGTYPVICLAPTVLRISMLLHRADQAGELLPYVAISHVWSDGLCNPKNNSIPSCQLRRLEGLVQQAGEQSERPKLTAFWLDTMCCSLEDGSDIQNIALEKMKEAYENAEIVLLLDSYLLQCTHKDLTAFEVIF